MIILKHIANYMPSRLDEKWNELFDSSLLRSHLFHASVVKTFLESVELSDTVYGILKLVMAAGNHANNLLIVRYLSDRSAHALMEEMVLGLFPNDSAMEKYLTSTVAAGSDDDLLRHLQVYELGAGAL